MSTYLTVRQMAKMLQNLDRWLDKAVTYAGTRGFEPGVLLQARLAPDMYPLVKQIQAAADSAKYTAARLTAKEAPVHADTEQTLEEIKQRIASVVSYLGTFTEQDFEGSETRKVVIPYIPGKAARGLDYLTEQALPNFSFHVSMAYAILRHNGVPVGKLDFIGPVTLENA